jgi:hypothetical protein
MRKWDCESLLLLKDREGDSRLRLKNRFAVRKAIVVNNDASYEFDSQSHLRMSSVPSLK